MVKVYDWWQQVAADYESRFGDAPSFKYDNIVNLGLILNAHDRTKAARSIKYPAVFLLAGVKETHRIDKSVIIRPKILIVTNSKRDYLFSERQQHTYKPILYPIFERLLVVLRRYHLQQYTKIDRDYISGALREASVDAGVSSLFNDSLDGIELDCELLIKSDCL